MNINIHDSSIMDRDIDPELIEEQFKSYIDSGGSREFILSRNDIEELHIGMGDELFHQFITSMEITVDVKGKEYIDSFNKHFTPEPTKVFKSDLEATIEKKGVYDTLVYKINEFRADYNNRGKKPKYIILSKDVHIKLRNEVNAHLTKSSTIDPTKERIMTNNKFHDIPILVYRSPDKEYLIDIV